MAELLGATQKWQGCDKVVMTFYGEDGTLGADSVTFDHVLNNTAKITTASPEVTDIMDEKNNVIASISKKGATTAEFTVIDVQEAVLVNVLKFKKRTDGSFSAPIDVNRLYAKIELYVSVGNVKLVCWKVPVGSSLNLESMADQFAQITVTGTCLVTKAMIGETEEDVLFDVVPLS